jgi:threonine-phosphate decarboxylase
MIYGHGDDIYNFSAPVKYNFSTNVRQDIDLTPLYDFLKSQVQLISSYPEPLGESLSEVIADYHNIEPENVLITNGTTEAIYLIAQLYSGETSAICAPTFSEYESACTIYEHHLRYTCREKFTNVHLTGAKLIWLCNPNNPTGEVFPRQNLEKIIGGNPNSYFIIDEAYSDFTAEDISLLNKINLFPNLIILKSLTKTYRVPGLRLGFIAADKTVINSLKKIKQPWSVNSLAIEAGKYIYGNMKRFSKPVLPLIQERKRLESILQSRFSFKIIPSETTFFTVEIPQGTSSGLKNYLVTEHGILIRDASNFRGLGERHIRLAALSKEADDALIQALEKRLCR